MDKFHKWLGKHYLYPVSYWLPTGMVVEIDTNSREHLSKRKYGYKLDGIIPRKKSSNSSKTTLHNTASLPTFRFALRVVNPVITSSVKTSRHLQAESSNTSMGPGGVPMKDGQAYLSSTQMRT